MNLLPNPSILVVDDEKNLRKILAVQLLQGGFNAIVASDGKQALDLLSQNTTIKVVITDLKMPNMSGTELMEKALKLYPHLVFIVLTAYGSINSAVDAVKNGAFHYLEKPFDKEILLKTVKEAEEYYSQQNNIYKSYEKIIGISPQIIKLINLIKKVAKTNSTVLITGESGTGKELVAQAIHDLSTRTGEPFIKVNCAAIPENLMESEFFGYEKGAFTGADTKKPGRFEIAGCGTLLLDEVAEIPLSMQAKLLRVLQENEFEPIGSLNTIQNQARILASTNKNLTKEVKIGTFREDLFYRLNVIPIQVPALRERKEDIPLLVEHFSRQISKQNNLQTKQFSKETMVILKNYHWLGNVRELKNIIERVILLTDSNIIEPLDLPEEIVGFTSTQILNSKKLKSKGLKELVKRESNKIETQLILKALKKTNGNITQAAKLLKLSRKGLQNKIKELNLK